MLSLLRTISLRQARRHPTRLALMVLSVALGVAAWTVGGALDRTLAAALKSTTAPLAGASDFLVSRGELGLPRSLGDELAAVAGVKSVRPVLVRRVLINDLGRSPAVLLGVDLATAAKASEAQALGLTIRDGSPAAFLRALVLKQNPVLIGAALEKALPAGSTRIEVLAAGTPKKVTRVGVVEAEGVAASLGGHVLLTDVKLAGELIGDPGVVTRFDVSMDPKADRAAVQAALASVVGDRGDVLTPETQDEGVRDALEGLRIGFSICGLGALALALFLTASAMSVGAAERKTEVGMLRALGADRRQVGRLFLIEAAILGLVGAAIGLPVGWGLAHVASGPLIKVVGELFLPLDARNVEVGVGTMLGGLAAGVLTTILAAVAPALRSAAMEPVEALARGEIDRQGRSAQTLLIAAVGCVLAAVALFAFGDAVMSPRLRVFGAAIPAATGALLAIPAVTSWGARLLRPLCERWLGLPGRLAADHLVRSPGRSGMAIASLAGGMALILQTGGVIHGNEAAIRDWVDRFVAGDLFVTSGGPLSSSGRTSPMREDVGPMIEEAFPGLRVVPFSFRYLPWRRDGHETRIRLLALDAPRYVRMNADRDPPLADIDLHRRLMEPGTVLVSENFAALYGVKVGDVVPLPGAKGPVPLKVVGTVVDFSCNRGTVMVDRSQYAEAFDCTSVDVYTIGKPPGYAVPDEEIRRRLPQTPWGAEQALFVLARPALREHILGMVARVYGVAYVQEVVAAVVAALGVAMSLLISVLQRRRELGLLRAVGATPAQAVKVILAEAVLMAVIGVAFGLAIGAGLEWYVLRVILLHESGFSFPVSFPWANAAAVAALALVGSLLAGLGPALRAARMPVHEAIAYE